MTTSEGAIKPTEPETPITGTVAKPDRDPRQLEQEIERTREQLGETVQELVARVDVIGRARAKTAEMQERVKSQTVQARDTAWESRERWMPLAAAAGVIIVGFTALWEWSRRSRASA